MYIEIFEFLFIFLIYTKVENHWYRYVKGDSKEKRNRISEDFLS